GGLTMVAERINDSDEAGRSTAVRW
ncbi:hypothetical protein A2U01_0062641, partial [Trifolium medium]|nr:hypothetical protein [Trifolium medium]